ncbi:MAG: 1-acyl-sn-glycerol-3-phosphate acyltransferase [Deltaproteobacteria bacterium]|nr:1-acyl-sn-glycerol-3-phosphate acyltransferase [Deltaproteobacteria bacterium]
MSSLSPWLVLLIYLVPIIGTISQIWRRMGQIWRIGEGVRSLLPFDDRLYRKIRVWDARFINWKRLHPLTQYTNLRSLNHLAGRIEYATGHFRDYTIGLYMMGTAVYEATLMVSWDPSIRGDLFLSLFYHTVFALLSLWTYRRHVAIGLQMTEFMRINPHVHPQEFFDHYYERLGPGAIPIPTRAERTVDPTNVSYLTGRPQRQTYWTWIHGAYDTALFARSAFRALEVLGKEYGREVFDVMASLWGSRMLQLFHAKMTVTGSEKLKSLSGKIILVFNHKTYLDFVFNFFALSSAQLADGRSLRPRYMAAKDHLVDNALVYNGFGIGKLVESVDMVFVDRQGKGQLAVSDASEKIVGKEIDLALYPQGTRALPNYGSLGERLDAGYYTTGGLNSLKKELGHLKKGCAYLAADAAIALRDKGVPLHLVFIGINGDATILPKGSFKIQTEGVVECHVGEILTLTSDDVREVEKSGQKYLELTGRIHREINRGLVKATGINETLKRRFLEDSRKDSIASKEQQLKLQGLLKQADQEENFLPFIILDRIFTLPFVERAPFLKELVARLTERGNLTDLSEQVTDQMFRYRGTELKRIVRQEQARRSA